MSKRRYNRPTKFEVVAGADVKIVLDDIEDYEWNQACRMFKKNVERLLSMPGERERYEKWKAERQVQTAL